MLLYADVSSFSFALGEFYAVTLLLMRVFVFVFFVSCYRCEDDSLSSINWVLNLARAAVLRHGVRGLVIDPHNELYHQRFVSQ